VGRVFGVKANLILIRRNQSDSTMNPKSALVITLLLLLAGIGGPHAALAHNGTDHAAQQSQKARAIAKCRLKSTPEEKKACFAKVKKRFGR
jgi:hypothetical protein